MNIPYLDASIKKAVVAIFDKKKAVLATHDSNFHTDDVFASAMLKTFFQFADRTCKVTVTRNPVDSPKLKTADIVYDIGRIYDPKTLRFDHHQSGGADTYTNGIKFSSVGLIWKHFGVSICALHTESVTGKLPSKKTAEAQALIVEKEVIRSIDAMDNGQLTHTLTFDEIDLLTIDKYVFMCKVGTASQGGSIEEKQKNLDKTFFEVVKLVEGMIGRILTYAVYKEQDSVAAIKAYTKAKDKRIIIVDRMYYFNFAHFPEPVFIVYPHTRGGWGIQVVDKDEVGFDARIRFPKSWGGKFDAELEQISGIQGLTFCHNALFLARADTKEIAIKVAYKAIELSK